MRSIEKSFEGLLFGARWLAAPIYLGLVFALIMLLVVFARQLMSAANELFALKLTLDHAVLAVLSFIDIALIANLVLIVIFAGYENFVSRMELDDHVDRPTWMGSVDFAALKMKLFASIVAITGIELLKSFMALRTDSEISPNDEAAAMWLIIIHLTFLLTGVLSALADWLSTRAKTRAKP